MKVIGELTLAAEAVRAAVALVDAWQCRMMDSLCPGVRAQVHVQGVAADRVGRLEGAATQRAYER